MKINLMLGLMICALLVTLMSYGQYHFGVNPENQFWQGAGFVTGIVFSIGSFLSWRLMSEDITVVEIFKKKKYRNHLYS